MNAKTKRGWQWVVGLFFIGAGANHFLTPKPYLSMMPSYLPAHAALVQISGVAEILGGIGILLPATQRLAAVGLILLLIAVFPANLNVALHGWPGESIPDWLLWFRLPFQILFIWWVYRIYVAHPEQSGTSSR
ncbi:MAG TPA: DoxX family protein [Verrucomicrobiae bacterium]|nr:DoxX family protein [Verrucomicrobiae bacterium]